MRYWPYYAAALFTTFGLVSGNDVWLFWAAGVAVLYSGWRAAESASVIRTWVRARRAWRRQR